MAIIPYNTGLGAVRETIDFAGGDPADYYQVELIGGIDYVATALGAANAGGTLRDPFLVLFDGAGNALEVADDSFVLGSDPLLQFQAPASGTYFIGVSDNLGSGSYTFTIDQAQPPVFFGGTESFGTFGG